MSRSTYLTTNEIPSTTDLRFHHGSMTTNRSNETLPIVVQSSTTKTTNTSIARNNPKVKRNLRDKRRSTGIRPDDVSLAGTSTEGSANDDNVDEENTSIRTTEANELFDHNQTISSSKPVFSVKRIQSTFENLSIPQAEPYIMTSTTNVYPVFRPEEFILCRREKQTTDDDSSTIKCRQLEERILAHESLLYDKDTIIHDLQRKLDNMTRDLADAEQQIYILHQEKLTLIKAFTALQDNKPSSGDLSIRTNFVPRH